MKLAIVGSSVLSDTQIEVAAWLISHILRADDEQPEEVVSGGAVGIDTIAEEAANDYLIPTKIFLPDIHRWEGTDTQKGFKARNIEIAEYCDELLCIRSEKSKTYGSGWTADYAEKLGKVVRRLKV